MVHGVGHAHGKIYDCHAGFSNWMQGWSDSKKVPRKKKKKTTGEFPFRGKRNVFCWVEWLGLVIG